MSYPAALLALLLSSTVATAQTRWLVAPDAGEGPKLGHAEAGSNNFFPLWMYCASESKVIVLNAYVGEQRPAGGRGSFSLTASGEPPVTVAGPVGAEPFDGLFTLEAKIDSGHPLLALLAKGKPMAYVGGTTRTALASSGLVAALQQWRVACR
jgi:hypothetical protein